MVSTPLADLLIALTQGMKKQITPNALAQVATIPFIEKETLPVEVESLDSVPNVGCGVGEEVGGVVLAGGVEIGDGGVTGAVGVG